MAAVPPPAVAAAIVVRTGADDQKSKYAYFLDHQQEAVNAYESRNEMFIGDDNPLLQELRAVYDWMAQEKNAKKMSSWTFKKRLPEIHKKFPMLANNFRRMDVNSDGWLEWEEFAPFCLKDKRLLKTMKRARGLTVYGIDAYGNRTFKEAHDPSHMCETSSAPQLLPWETAHVVEWRIEGLQLSRRGSPVYYGGVPLRPGQSITSQPFSAGGVTGFFRFYPSGFWTESQRRKKQGQVASSDEAAAGLLEQEGTMWKPHPLPSPDSWCCLGVFAPQGSRLVVRYFVGDTKSETRHCYWMGSVHASQVWSPPEQGTPPHWQPGDAVTVGVEILKNVNSGLHTKATNLCMTAASRRAKRPSATTPGFTGLVSGSVLLNQRPPATATTMAKSRSLPSLQAARPSTSPS